MTNDEKTDDEESSDKYVVEETHKAPDGGWGWFVLLSAIVIRIIGGGLVRSNGLLYVRYLDRFGGTAAQTALITSLNTTCNMLIGPFVNILCNRIAARNLTLIGSTLFVTSLMASGFATSLVLMYFLYGVLGGIGRSFMNTPTMILLGYYFDKRRSIAFGLASAGMGTGGFTITPAIGPLFDHYGFTGAFIFLSGIAMHTFVCALLMRPIDAQTRPVDTVDLKTQNENDRHASCEEDQEGKALFVSKMSSTGSIYLNLDESLAINYEDPSPDDLNNDHAENQRSVFAKVLASIRATFKGDDSKKALFSFSVLKDIRFVTMALAMFLYMLPNLGLFLPVLAKDRGLTVIEAGYLVSIQSVVDTSTRIIAGFVFNLGPMKELRAWIYNSVVFIQVVLYISFPSLSTFGQFAGLICVHGVTNGITFSQYPLILVDILGLEKLTSTNAIIQTMIGLAHLVGPPISGMLKDTYGKYDYTFYFGGTAALLGAILLLVGNTRNYCLQKSIIRQRREEEVNNIDDIVNEDHELSNDRDDNVNVSNKLLPQNS